jgi:hypothetical protein
LHLHTYAEKLHDMGFLENCLFAEKWTKYTQIMIIALTPGCQVHRQAGPRGQGRSGVHVRGRARQAVRRGDTFNEFSIYPEKFRTNCYSSSNYRETFI